jgi:hypothetical protein
LMGNLRTIIQLPFQIRPAERCETVKGFLGWVGLDYVLNPIESFLENKIEVLGVKS